MEIRFGDRMLLMASWGREQRCFDGRFAANWLSVLALIFLWKSLCLTIDKRITGIGNTPISGLEARLRSRPLAAIVLMVNVLIPPASLLRKLDLK